MGIAASKSFGFTSRMWRSSDRGDSSKTHKNDKRDLHSIESLISMNRLDVNI